jgi:hypothetical protein
VLCRAVCVLLFLAWTAEPPVANDPTLYCGLWRSPLSALGGLFVALPGVRLTPWQLAVVALAPACLLGRGRRAPLMDAAIALSLGSAALTFAWGWARGGSPYQAYYQLWKFLAALLVALLLPVALRSAAHLRALGRTVVAAAAVRASLAIAFYAAVARDRTEPLPYMTAHDDSLLFVGGLVVLLCWALAARTPAAWSAALGVGALLGAAIALNNRRLAWIELGVALLIVFLALPAGAMRRRANRVLLVAAPVALLYVAAGWNRPGPFFGPLKAISTALSYEDASALAREEEIRNLLHTLGKTRNPLFGTGWGLPYQKVTSVYANFGAEWWQYEYLPHNSLLGVAVFGGFAGLAGMWTVVPVASFLAMRAAARAEGRLAKAASLSALGLLPAYAVQCYGDLGFQSLTCGLLLAGALGVASRVAAGDIRRPAPRGRAGTAERGAELWAGGPDAHPPAASARG